MAEELNLRFAVTAIDISDAAKGHAELIGLFETHEGALAYVKEDMKDVLANMGSDEETIVDWDGLEVWVDASRKSGCVWDIHDLQSAKVKEGSSGE